MLTRASAAPQAEIAPPTSSVVLPSGFFSVAKAAHPGGSRVHQAGAVRRRSGARPSPGRQFERTKLVERNSEAGHECRSRQKERRLKMSDPEIQAFRAKLASRPRSADYRQRRKDID